METINFKARDGQGNETFLLEVELQSGSSGDLFIESELSKNTDGGSGVKADGEGFHNNGVNGSWLVGSI